MLEFARCLDLTIPTILKGGRTAFHGLRQRVVVCFET
jgi:hypothetical protein